MTTRSAQRTRRLTAAALTLIAAAATTGPAAAAVPAPAGARAATPQAASSWGLTPRRETAAVVTLAGPTAVTVPGVRVTALLGAVGAELVRGRPAALARLARDPRVRGVAPDRALQLTGTDPGTGPSRYASAGLGGGAGTAGAGAGATVAVLDTGVSDTAGLNRSSGRLVDGVDTSPVARDNPARTEGRFTDGYGHGTFMASLVAAGPVGGTGGQALGVAPGARVVVVKVADSRGRTALSSVLAGMDWVATHRPISVLSIALTAPSPTAAYGANPLTAAVEHVRASGVAVVVAAGNDPGRVGTPGTDPAAITIGAADLTGSAPVVADFSGRDTVAGLAKPDLVASGSSLIGQLPGGSVLAVRYPEAEVRPGIWRGSGTSQATAVTAGAAAIYLSRFPDASPVELKTALRAGASPLAGAAGSGAGVLTVPTGRPAAGTPTGEEGFDAAAWAAGAWRSGGWAALLASSWGSDSWSADWNADNPWAASSWGASSWGASSWGASSWGASSWGASSWGASSWGAGSWG